MAEENERMLLEKAAEQGDESARHQFGLLNLKAEETAVYEKRRERVMKSLINKLIPVPEGCQSAALAGIPVADPKRFIYLLRSMDGKNEDSLWNVEVIDDDETVRMWPYKGEDTEELIMYLIERHVETAFVNVIT